MNAKNKRIISLETILSSKYKNEKINVITFFELHLVNITCSKIFSIKEKKEEWHDKNKGINRGERRH